MARGGASRPWLQAVDSLLIAAARERNRQCDPSFAVLLFFHDFHRAAFSKPGQHGRCTRAWRRRGSRRKRLLPSAASRPPAAAAGCCSSPATRGSHMRRARHVRRRSRASRRWSHSPGRGVTCEVLLRVYASARWRTDVPGTPRRSVTSSIRSIGCRADRVDLRCPSSPESSRMTSPAWTLFSVTVLTMAISADAA